MAEGDDYRIFIPPKATAEQLDARVLQDCELVADRTHYKLRLGDGTTVGGIVLGVGDGGTGGGPGFGIIGVTGADESTWPRAAEANAVLMLVPTRGLIIVPSATNDSVQIGFPDPGAYGNVWTGLGQTAGWAAPPEVAYVPQEGDIATSILVEDGPRKLGDGVSNLVVFLAPANPAVIGAYYGETVPIMPDAATGLLRTRVRLLDCGYSGASLRLKLGSESSGDVRMVARVAKPSSVADDPVFDTDNLATVAITGGTDAVAAISLTNIDDAEPGDEIIIEFGRLGADGADTLTDNLAVVNAWVVVL